MSVYSQSIFWKTIAKVRTEKSEVSESSQSTKILNVCLLGAVFVMLCYYIIQANVIAANGYKAKIYSDQLTSLNEANTSMVAKIQAASDNISLAKFAESQGMVQAKTPGYLFENGNVAFQR